MEKRKKRRTNKTWWQRYSLYVLVPLGLATVFILGIIIGASWANALNQKENLTPSEKAFTQLQLTSDSVWNGEVRR